MVQPNPDKFDPYAKEAQLRVEAQAWDTSVIEDARPGEIPVIDLAGYLENKDSDSLAAVAAQIHDACTRSGFCSITGHQFPAQLLQDAFHQNRKFHALPDELKKSLEMDQPDCPVKGVGYLPYSNYKLPARDKGNLNETFIIKHDHLISLDDNLWLDEKLLPGFRSTISRYAAQLERLAKQLLPIYASALRLDRDFFAEAFETPLYRMRLTRYKPTPDLEAGQFGIAPHVDTSFITILAQDSPGLVIFSEQRQRWIRVPVIDNAFIVNTGELLKQWSNDYFISVKHYACNTGGIRARYSIPFFFNARPDYVMRCLPSCFDEDHPAKYTPISYLQSQAVVQGE